LALSFNLIVVSCKADYRIVDIAADLNKRSELNMKNYEIAILTTVVINSDPINSTEINFKIDVVEILVIFVFIRSVDIY
jgi:hypothetical protein